MLSLNASIEAARAGDAGRVHLYSLLHAGRRHGILHSGRCGRLFRLPFRKDVLSLSFALYYFLFFF